MAFKKGHKFSKGGARPGSGRPSDWLRDKCQGLISRHKLIEFLAQVASGEYMENVFDGSQKTGLMRSAEAKDRMRAVEMLLDRGFGKAQQSIEHSGNLQTGNLVVVLPGTPKKAA
jgi:hypothetical protein